MIATSASPPTVAGHAASVVGREHVEVVGNLCAAAPADALQAAELLRFADAQGLAVAIEGAGSKRGWVDEAPIDLRLRTNLRLRTHRMNTVREHTWQDMTCTVEAGCGWGAMQRVLKEHGQQVALDPLWPERATVGGVIGANDSGSLRLRYGGLRDLVIGMTLVLADGTIARSGGKVVKNVAGYDLPKLLCGSFGTLALITEVTFRLHSIARHTTTVTATATSAEALHKLLLRLLDSHFSTQSMQLRTSVEGFALDVRLAALPEVLATQRDGLMGVAGSMGLTAKCSQEDVWTAREELFATGSTVFKATMLPSALGTTVQAIHDLCGSAVAQATGIVTGRLPVDVAAEKLAQLRSQLEAAGGSLTVLSAAQEVAFDRWGAMPSSLPVMRAVKEHFDPKQTLNRGRFLGQI
jgi:glycolate oxidase FAD binding subunit